MHRVLITLATKPIPTHRIAVVVITPDGQRNQEHLNRSLRDARIFANGVCAAAPYSPNPHEWPVNPELDACLQDVE